MGQVRHIDTQSLHQTVLLCIRATDAQNCFALEVASCPCQLLGLETLDLETSVVVN